jgi:hypothetical protein
MMQSVSSHKIEWHRPDILSEQWEFFSHPAKQEYYQRYGISWEQLLESFGNGRMAPYPRGDRIGGAIVALSYSSYEDYARYLAKAKRGYRLNYVKMEEELQRTAQLTLPAPIVIDCNGDALLFSGYRRLCLAWNYGMVPYVWLVSLAAR